MNHDLAILPASEPVYLADLAPLYLHSGFEEIKTSVTTIVSGSDKILKRARLMEEEIGKRLAMLGTNVQRLRSGDEERGV